MDWVGALSAHISRLHPVHDLGKRKETHDAHAPPQRKKEPAPQELTRPLGRPWRRAHSGRRCRHCTRRPLARAERSARAGPRAAPPLWMRRAAGVARLMRQPGRGPQRCCPRVPAASKSVSRASQPLARWRARGSPRGLLAAPRPEQRWLGVAPSRQRAARGRRGGGRTDPPSRTPRARASGPRTSRAPRGCTTPSANKNAGKHWREIRTKNKGRCRQPE